MPRIYNHDVCDCGKTKQVVSKHCRDCYLNTMGSFKKRCVLCNIVKAKTNYYKNQDSADGYRNSCKQCVNTSNKIPCKCGKLMDNRSKLCVNCRRESDWLKVTKDSRPISMFSYGNSKGPNEFVKIRSHARRWSKKLGRLNDGCNTCPFTFAVEVCHIIPIRDWPLETTLSAVNHPANIIILCPNCHWLFDHGFNSEDKIREYLKLNKLQHK